MTVTSPSKCSNCIIAREGICSRIAPRTRAILASQTAILQYKANQIIWDGEDPPRFVGIVMSGCLRMQRYGIQGRRQIVGLFRLGDVIGGLARAPRDHSIAAATDASFCRVDRHVFQRLIEQDRGLQRAVYDQQAAKLEELRRLTGSLGGLTAAERLTAFLASATTCMPCQPQADSSLILTVDLPRADIADLLGTSVETISRISRRLEAEGVIEIISPRHFRIADLMSLVRLGCLERSFDRMPGALPPQMTKPRMPDQISPAHRPGLAPERAAPARPARLPAARFPAAAGVAMRQ